MATYQVKTAVPEFSGQYTVAACPEGYFKFTITALNHPENTNCIVANREDVYYITRSTPAEAPSHPSSAVELAIRQYGQVLFVFQSTTNEKRTVTITTQFNNPEVVDPDEPLVVTGLYFNEGVEPWAVKHFHRCCPTLHHPRHGEVFHNQNVVLFAAQLLID